jgi:hypothetical protein
VLAHRPRCIFNSGIAKKLMLTIYNIINNTFKKLQPTMMGKNLPAVSNVIFDTRISNGVRIATDFSKFESTPGAEAVDKLCRGMVRKLVYSCPDAFDSDILGRDVVEFLLNVLM